MLYECEEKHILCNIVFVNLLFVLFLVLLVIYGKEFIYFMIFLLTIFYHTCQKIEQHSQIDQKILIPLPPTLIS